MRALAGRAQFDGVCHRTWIRIAQDIDGSIYIDLGNTDWNAIQITSNGWTVISDPPVKFIRNAGMQPLPFPEPGGMIEELKPFLNASSDADFTLIVGWLVAALRPSGPYPILVVSGEQGSGKSFVTRVLRDLVDPNVSPCRAMPRQERDLLIAARNSQVLSFDNLSNIDAATSDALCRVSTGGGLSTRKLYTNDEEIILDVARPVIANGIPDLVSRPDLADRTFTVRLSAISDDQRRSEHDLTEDFERARPAVLGALCDAVSSALRNFDEVRANPAGELPRLADAALWIEAAADGMGWAPGAFLRAHHEDRITKIHDMLDNDLVAQAIRKFLEHRQFWRGSASELLEILNKECPPRITSSHSWPSTPQKIGMRLSRLAPALRKVREIDVSRGKNEISRYWTIRLLGQGD